MKYALFIYTWFFLFISPVAHSSHVHSFKDSPALMTVVQFMNEVKGDLEYAVVLSDKKLKLKSIEGCIDIQASAVYREVEKGIKKVVRFYPDEELPLEDAFADLENFIGNKLYKSCIFLKQTQEQVIETHYYFDTNHKTHLRMDIITPVHDY